MAALAPPVRALADHFPSGAAALRAQLLGAWLELEQAKKSGYHVVISAAVLTVVCWIAGYAAM